MLYEKSKEYSDIPNPLGASPTKGGPFKKRSTPATSPTKQPTASSTTSEDDDHNGSANGSSSSLLATPVKRKTSRDTDDESPSKKRHVSRDDIVYLCVVKTSAK